MSGIEDQGLRPEKVEQAPVDESEPSTDSGSQTEPEQPGHPSQAEGEDPAKTETHPDPALPGHPSPAEGGGDTGTTHPPSQDSQEQAEEPSTQDLKEPSTEKEPGEEPKAPDRAEPEPSHEAVGIGIVGRPQTEMEDETD